MYRRSLLNLIVPAALLLGCNSALAESRLALVIGQSAYRSVPALPNPTNDAKAMSQLLSESGFEVLSASDLSQSQIREKVSEFAGKVAEKGPDTVALVFYAGHGLQIDGENYLVPIDVDPRREADIPLQAVRLNDILNALTSVPNKMRILLLDACRNNPFPELNKTAGHGLALVDTKVGKSRHLPVVLDLTRRGGRRWQRRRQSLHDGAARCRQGAGIDRGDLQARPRLRQQGDRWTSDAMGQLFADRRFQVCG